MLPLKQHHDRSVGFMAVPTTLTYDSTSTALAAPYAQVNIPISDPSPILGNMHRIFGTSGCSIHVTLGCPIISQL